MPDVDPHARVGRDDLVRAIEHVLARRPGSTAREVRAALPSAMRSGVTRRDVNSVLYKGASGRFVRSGDAKPRWSLRSGPSAPDGPAATPGAPETEDIARILFED